MITDSLLISLNYFLKCIIKINKAVVVKIVKMVFTLLFSGCGLSNWMLGNFPDSVVIPK